MRLGLLAVLAIVIQLHGATPSHAQDDGTFEQRVQSFFNFIDLAYDEYEEGVSSGTIIHEEEYDEALEFREQASVVFGELQPTLAQTNPDAADQIANLLAEMERVMQQIGDPALLRDLVDDTKSLIQTAVEIAPESSESSPFETINHLLSDLLADVKTGDYADAEQARLEAYAEFDSELEMRLSNRAPNLGRDLEGLFWEGSDGHKGLAVLLSEQASADNIETVIEQLHDKLDEAEGYFDSPLTGWLAFLSSTAIIIREGLEAVLIIAAILGTMRASNTPRRFSLWIYLGGAAALLLSIVTWWAADHLITISVQNRELIEGITSLAAVAVLFFVTNWLFHKTYVIDWMAFVRQTVRKALSSRSALALAGLGFTVVYREGFETVLFYQALLFDADTLPVIIGFAAGLLVILIVAWLILHLSTRLPLKPFFTGTTVLMLLLAINLAGSGIRELQEAGVIGTTLLSAVPEHVILTEGLGLFPTVETVLAQLILLIGVVVTFSYSRWRGVRKTSPATS
jgi:high-affinity iron transporter